MKWIVFALVGFIKILIISILVLLSVTMLPIIALILLLGMVLGTIRNHEPGLYNNTYSLFQIAQAIFSNIKITCDYLFPQQTHLLQHIFIDRNKTRL